MKNIKCAKSIQELLLIASKQCKKESCRVGIWFNDAENIRRIINDGFAVDLTWVRYDSGLLKMCVERCDDTHSWIEVISPAYPYPRGKRYDYILIDSTLPDEAKIIARAMIVRGCFFMKNDKAYYRRDKRKNSIQEFTLAEKWPLLD